MKAHLGDPFAEQHALLAGEAWVLSDAGVLSVSGSDRLSWLNSLTTQKLDALAPGEPAEALVLSPKGHIEHDLHLVDDGERTWVTTDAGHAPGLAAFLTSMRFMLDVAVTDHSDELAVVAGPTAYAAEGVLWRDGWPGIVGDGFAYGAAPESHPGAGWSWTERIMPRDEVDLAGHEAGEEAWTALRIAAGRPRVAAEVDHRTIPHELDWLRTAVHLHKGCYRGQETIARVKNLGRPPRRIVFLHLDGSEHVLPEVGSELLVGERAVGRLTSMGRHHELGPVGLGVIKRNTPTDATLEVVGADITVPATQEILVEP